LAGCQRGTVSNPETSPETARKKKKREAGTGRMKTRKGKIRRKGVSNNQQGRKKGLAIENFPLFFMKKKRGGKKKGSGNFFLVSRETRKALRAKPRKLVGKKKKILISQTKEKKGKPNALSPAPKGEIGGKKKKKGGSRLDGKGGKRENDGALPPPPPKKQNPEKKRLK